MGTAAGATASGAALGAIVALGGIATGGIALGVMGGAIWLFGGATGAAAYEIEENSNLSEDNILGYVESQDYLI